VKRRALFAVCVALAACRGAIGIEDLQLAPDGGSPSGDSGTEGGTPPPGTPPPATPPPGTPPPPPDAGSCFNMMPCQKCCRDSYTGEGAALDMKIHSCVCGSGGCGMAGTCGTDNYCTGGMPGMPCAHDCIDPALFDAACPAVHDCRAAGSGCQTVATCIAGCPPLM
jgi:hypothetical protein